MNGITNFLYTIQNRRLQGNKSINKTIIHVVVYECMFCVHCKLFSLIFIFTENNTKTLCFIVLQTYRHMYIRVAPKFWKNNVSNLNEILFLDYQRYLKFVKMFVLVLSFRELKKVLQISTKYKIWIIDTKRKVFSN